MNLLRTVIRLLLICAHMIIGVVLCIVALPSNWDRSVSDRQRNIVRWWLHTCTRIIGIRTRVCGTPDDRVALVVANHISWIDVVLIGGLRPVSFLSKAEISKWPVIGYLARKGGTLFIERGNGFEHAAQLIGQRLHSGSSVAFFPEGTTSDGTEIRRFHPRLFMAAIDGNISVQPVVIEYPDQHAPTGVHPKASYSSDTSFISHALTILGEPHIRATVHYTDSLPSGGNDRRQLAETAREMMIAEQRKNR